MKVLFTLIFTASISLVASAKAEVVTGAELLNAFGSSCKPVGSWTTTALADSTALINSINDAKNDPACVSVGGAISSLGSLQTELNLFSQNNGAVQFAHLNGQEQTLITQLAATTDPNIAISLETALSSVQSNLATLMSQYPPNQLLPQSTTANALSQIVVNANTALNQVMSNQSCLLQKPQVLSSALALTASIGATIAVANPTLGLGLAAGASFIGGLADSINSATISMKVRKLAVGSTILEAYQCALSTLSEHWCDANDAQKMLVFNKNYHDSHSMNDGFASAIELEERQIPTLINWLDTVRAGVSPSRVSDATADIAVFYDQASVPAATDWGNGYLAEGQKKFDASVALAGQSIQQAEWSVIQNVINQILPQGYGFGGQTQPFMGLLYEIHASSLGPYYLLGLDSIPLSAGQAIPWSSFNPFTQWPATNNNGVYTPNYATLKNQFSNWIVSAQSLVNTETVTYLQPDPLRILTSGFDVTGNQWKLSVYDSLKTLIDFIVQNPLKANPIYDNIYADTLTKLRNLKSDLDQVNVSGATDKSLNDALTNVAQQVQLQYGTSLFQARLELIVRLSLYEYISKIPANQKNVAAQLLAANQFSDVLSTMNGHESFDDLYADMTNSKAITASNIQSFANVFAKNIKKVLQNLKATEDEYQRQENSTTPNSSPTMADDARDQRTRLCYGLAAIPTWPKKIDRSLCEGLSLTPLMLGAPKSPVMNDAFFSSSPENRICTMHEYSRAQKVFQDWNIVIPHK